MNNSAVWFAVRGSSGWHVSMIEPPRFPDMDMLARKSVGGRVIAVVAAEDGRSSLACEFRDGRPVWSISRDPTAEGDQLVIDGEAPEAYEALAGAGIFDSGRELDVAVEVAYAITGFRHDVAPVTASRFGSAQLRVVAA